MTAVEWLLQELEKVNYHTTEAMIMYAKKLEKKQIIDAWENGAQAEHRAKVSGLADSNSFSYYNETYGSKGSDDKQKESLDFLVSQAQEMGLYDTSSQTEIS